MWQAPVWSDRNKHKAPPRIEWSELVRNTANSDAVYHPHFSSSARRQALEMRCVKEGVEIPQNHHAKKCFYLKMDAVIGASDGKEAHYVYAEWAMSGFVHGRPISETELQRKGIRL